MEKSILPLGRQLERLQCGFVFEVGTSNKKKKLKVREEVGVSGSECLRGVSGFGRTDCERGRQRGVVGSQPCSVREEWRVGV